MVRSRHVNVCTLAAILFGFGFAKHLVVAEESARPSGQLTITGTVLMPDGSPAGDAVVASLGLGKGERSGTVRTDRQGRFQLTGEFAFDVLLHARSRDDTYQTTWRVSRILARTRLANPVELQMAPAREIAVAVRSSGKPLETAHVVAVGLGYTVNEMTAANGTASLRIPSNAKLDALVAWHPAHGIAAKRAPEGADKTLSGQTFQLSLLAPAAHLPRDRQRWTASSQRKVWSECFH